MVRECRKCGCTQIRGPVHDAEADRLRFFCTQCSFTWSTPTKDQIERDIRSAQDPRHTNHD